MTLPEETACRVTEPVRAQLPGQSSSKDKFHAFLVACFSGSALGFHFFNQKTALADFSLSPQGYQTIALFSGFPVLITYLVAGTALAFALIRLLKYGFGKYTPVETDVRREARRLLPFAFLWLPALRFNPAAMELSGPAIELIFRHRDFLFLIVLSYWIFSILKDMNFILERFKNRFGAWGLRRIMVKTLPILLFLLSLIVIRAFTARITPRVALSGDEPQYLKLTDSFAYDLDFNLADDEPGYNEYWPADWLRLHHELRGAGSGIYSIHSIGSAILTAIPYRLFGLDGIVGIFNLMGALTALLLFLFMKNKMRLWTAALFSVAGSLSVPIIFFSLRIYPELPAAFLTFFLFYEAFKNRKYKRLWGLICGGALAFLPFFHIKYALLSALLLVVTAVSSPGRKKLLTLPFWFGLVVGAGSLAFYYFKSFGTVNPFLAYEEYVQSTSILDLSMIKGIPALLFDGEFGLLVYSPFFILALPGFIHLFWTKKKHGREDKIKCRIMGGAVLLVVVPYFLMVASHTSFRWMGYSPPARFLAPIVLLLVPVAGFGFEKLNRGFARTVAVALLLLSLLYPLSVFKEPRLLHHRLEYVSPPHSGPAAEKAGLFPELVRETQPPDKNNRSLLLFSLLLLFFPFLSLNAFNRGRRPILTASAAMFIAASIWCALIPEKQRILDHYSRNAQLHRKMNLYSSLSAFSQNSRSLTAVNRIANPENFVLIPYEYNRKTGKWSRRLPPGAYQLIVELHELPPHDFFMQMEEPYFRRNFIGEDEIKHTIKKGANGEMHTISTWTKQVWLDESGTSIIAVNYPHLINSIGVRPDLNLYSAAESAFEDSDYQTVIELLETRMQEIRDSDGEAHAHALLGAAYGRNNRLLKSATHYEKAIELRPGDYSLLVRLINAYAERNMWDSVLYRLERMDLRQAAEQLTTAYDAAEIISCPWTQISGAGVRYNDRHRADDVNFHGENRQFMTPFTVEFIFQCAKDNPENTFILKNAQVIEKKTNSLKYQPGDPGKRTFALQYAGEGPCMLQKILFSPLLEEWYFRRKWEAHEALIESCLGIAAVTDLPERNRSGFLELGRKHLRLIMEMDMPPDFDGKQRIQAWQSRFKLLSESL